MNPSESLDYFTGLWYEHNGKEQPEDTENYGNDLSDRETITWKWIDGKMQPVDSENKPYKILGVHI